MNNNDFNQSYHLGSTGAPPKNAEQANNDAYIRGRAEWLALASRFIQRQRTFTPPLQGGKKTFWVFAIVCIITAAIGLMYMASSTDSVQSRSDQWLERQHAQRDQFNRDDPALAKKFAATRK